MVTWRHTSPLYSGLTLQVEISVAKELQVHFLANYATVLVCQSLLYRLDIQATPLYFSLTFYRCDPTLRKTRTVQFHSSHFQEFVLAINLC